MKTRILIILSQVERDFVVAIHQHVARFALDWQLEVLTLSELGRCPNLPERVAGEFAGIIANTSPHRFAGFQARCQVALCDRAGPGHSGCWLDDRAVGRLAARHFREQGLRRVATVRPWNHEHRRRRFAAFLRAAEDLELVCHRWEPPSATDPKANQAALLAWLGQTPKPLGILFHQDSDALDFQRLCADHGLAVGRDLLTLGVDDIPACGTAQPPLSSIAMPWTRLGREMAIEFQSLLGRPGAFGRVRLIAPLRVMGRASTERADSGDTVVDAVRRALGHDPARGSVAELAARHGLSASQLRRRFQAAIAMSPVAWRNHCRIRLAQNLLVDTDLTHDAIARRCGLANATALWDLFRRNDLQAPSHWRQVEVGAVPWRGPGHNKLTS